LASVTNLISHGVVFGWFAFKTFRSLEIICYSRTLSLMQWECLFSFIIKLGHGLIGKTQIPHLHILIDTLISIVSN